MHATASPLERPARLSARLGVDLRLKRDDFLPISGGGNKVRKLHAIFREAETTHCRSVVTHGGTQSNHARVAALMAAERGWRCKLILHGDPQSPLLLAGNGLLMYLAGAEIEIVPPDQIMPHVERATAALATAGAAPYVIPGGGHCLAGVMAYADAVAEVAAQLTDESWRPDTIIVPSGTGATQAGILVGVQRLGWSTRVIGISVGRANPRGRDAVSEAAADALQSLGLPAHDAHVDFRDDWLCGDYEKANTHVLDTVTSIAHRHGLILDPTYTGKAFAALMDLIEDGEIHRGEKVLFWHTGGLLNLLSSQYFRAPDDFVCCQHQGEHSLVNVLLSSAGRRNYLVRYFQEALQGRGRVLVTDASASAPVLAEADQGFVVPPVHAADYFDTLLAICSEQQVDLLVSLNDLELPALARHSARFLQAGTRVAISAPEVIDLCADKVATARFLDEHAIRSPQTFTSLEAAHAALASRTIRFPLVVKARWGSGSLGLKIVEDEEELQMAYRFVVKQLQRSALAHLADSPATVPVVVQPCLAGTEFHLDVVNDLAGGYQATLCKEKLAMRAGETDKAMTLRSTALENLGACLGRALRHVGNLDVDVISGPAGDFVIDLNPRFGGGYPFSHVAGANVPAALLAWAAGSTPHPDWLRVRPGVVSAKCERLVNLSGADAQNRDDAPVMPRSVERRGLS